MELKWVDVVQTVGIIIGFVITFYQLRETYKITKFDIFWRIGDSHREVWRPLLEHQDLDRVLSNIPSPDLRISDKERYFVINVILHIENVYRAYKSGYYIIEENEKKDVGELFMLPMFRKIWNEVKEYHSPDFVKHVEDFKSFVSAKEESHEAH